eukprot:74331_1
MASVQDQRRLTSKGDTAFANMEKVNCELFIMTYGAIVIQLIKDIGDIDKVNARLESMGYNIGTRLIDEFLSKAQIKKCKNFQETAELIARVGFKMFLGIEGQIKTWEDDTTFYLDLTNNPLNDFVELPPQFKGKLAYCNILCGIIRGGLEMIQLKVECQYTKSILYGNDCDQIKVSLLEVLEDVFADDDD